MTSVTPGSVIHSITVKCMFCMQELIGQVHLVGPLIPLFWISCDVPSGFQSQSVQPYSCSVEVHVLHIPCDSPLVWHLLTFWQPAWQPSQSFPHTCEKELVELETGTYCAADECSINWTLPAWLISINFHWRPETEYWYFRQKLEKFLQAANVFLPNFAKNQMELKKF